MSDVNGALTPTLTLARPSAQAASPTVLKRYQELAQLEIAAKRKGAKAGASNFQDTVVRCVHTSLWRTSCVAARCHPAA